MRITAGVTSIFKFLTATIGVALPACPVVICLAFRGVEGWKLWFKMSHFSLLGMLAWLWTFAYLAACVVTIFRLDDERNLRWWEFLIDSGNMVTSCILAMKCAKQQFDIDLPISYGVRFALWLSVCLIAQFTVTFVARRARKISQRLYRQLNPKPAKAIQRSRARIVEAASQSLVPSPVTGIDATIDEADRVAEVLVGQ